MAPVRPGLPPACMPGGRRMTTSQRNSVSTTRSLFSGHAWPRSPPRRLFQPAVRREPLLVGIQVGPRPRHTLVAAVVRPVAVVRLPRPQTDAVATDLALEAAQAQLLLATGVKAVHRMRVREQRRAVVGDGG